LLSIAGSPDARFAALIGGSVEATVVNSPFEYRAEQEGFKVLLPIKETAESVKSDQRVEHVAAEIARKPDEIGRMLRALHNANWQNQREISAGLVEKLLKLDRPSPRGSMLSTRAV
jgi:ABC-type nitrate/sulfonate/bicarbonate transport system substrate-binding protein